MKAFPIAWVTTGRRLLIVGGGAETAGRINHALLFDWSRIDVVVPQKIDLHHARLHIRIGTVCEDDVKNADMVIEDCGDKGTAAILHGWCKTHHKIFNAMDKPELCDFYYMSMLFRDPLVLAISSGGDAPALSSALRRWLEEHVGEGWSKAAQFLTQTRQKLPSGQTRMELLKKLARDPHLLELIEKNDEIALRDWIEHAKTPYM